jgi:3-hydroxyacyl-CoA dehydrogenase/enoyl-CoA hydratase/3-hydroxybutyryl-CoA epimerase/3-hydroxyacyl-CoA dehydrogenase/enoyl-CoA hydratase/3-hydroxybutyryl-CoA epimerase/enoyl-CoA isomerase
MPALHLDVSNNLAVLTFDTPNSRANTLGQAIQTEFEQVLGQLRGQPGLDGLVFKSGKPGMFIAGADLKELGAAPPDPDTTRKLCRRGLDIIAGFESLPFPTVALIDGGCMGGGLELALGFDYRLAGSHPKCEIGLPETKIGLIPGWGGTQRLSRVIGPAIAAEMICPGEPANAQRAREIGLVWDAVLSERLMEEAVRLLKWAKESGDWKEQRKKKQQPVGLSEDQASFLFAVARGQVMLKTKGQLPAPLAALTAIEKGCNLPLPEGLKVETELFVPLIGSPIARNLIAVFFQQQRVAKDTGVADASVKPRDVQRVGVLGAGIMGSGITGAHIRKGVATLMLDNAPGAVERGLGNITKVMQGRVEIGRMKPEEVLAALSKLATAADLKQMADRDVVIEAVVENETVKKDVYRELQPILPDNAILASNTSTISITRMSGAWKNPTNFAGMHFFNPVDRMQLVEVIRGVKTGDDTVATLVALARKIGKTPIVVKDCPGFLVNRILFPYINESLVLLEEGAEPRAIDKAATAFGMPMGPVTLNDLVGLDTSLYAGQVVNTAFADRAKNTRILEELVKAGRLGQKSGAGFYSYARGSKGADDPAFAALLDKVRTGKRVFDMEEITDRLFLSMLTEATRCVEETIVRDPGDVDMGLILGIGFPPWRGGILRWGDTLGWGVVREKLKKYEPLGKRFDATAMIQKLAAGGKKVFGG